MGYMTDVPEELRIKLAKYLNELKDKRNLGFNQLSAKTKINARSLNLILNGETKRISPYQLQNLAQAFKIDYKELYKIVGYLEDANEEKQKSNVERIITKKVPLYGTASAGPGYINLSEEIEEFLIPIEDYKPGRFAVRVKGDSMTGPERSIPDGTVALVDPNMCGDVEELVNKVCIFTYDGETFIKQLLINSQNIIQLASFNPHVEKIIILYPKELKCDGRVVKTWSEQSW